MKKQNDMTDASELLMKKVAETRYETTREAEQRKPIAEARGLSEEELMEKFRLEMFNNVLPTLPDIPGYHNCWLSTTNKYDSLASREAKGYTRIRPDELPGFEHIAMTEGQFAGCIMMNEMIAAKLPLNLYQGYMRIAHHERPYAEEEKIRETARYLKEQAQEGGGDVYLGNGTAEIVNQRRRREPIFSE